MKKVLLYAAFIAASFTSIAQVGIGTTTPDASATLEIASTTKGLLLPRLTTMQRDAIVTPAQGLMIYCIDCGSGEISFFNGSIWSGSPVFTVPGAPVIGAATAGNGQATVSYTAPAANGGSVITGYTATSSPWGITGALSQAGSGVITVTGLTNGTAYTFTVTATNTNGTGAASAISNSVTPAAPNVTTQVEVASDNSGGTFTFLNHNLGADTSLDPHTPVKGLNGDYYQWGKNLPDADVDGLIGSTWGDQGGTTANGNWTPGAKGPQDPCPDGFRVPSETEWVAVRDNNTFSRTGPFTLGSTEYGSALHYGSATTPKLLTLPAAGNHGLQSGGFSGRGSEGLYWSSAENGSNAYFFFFNGGSLNPATFNDRKMGFSVRCIAE